MCFLDNVNQPFISYIQSDYRIILRNIHKSCLILIRVHTSSSAPPNQSIFFYKFECKSLFFLFLLADAGTINLHGQIR